MLTEENIRSGMEAEAARRAAVLLKVGSRDAAIELHRETRGLPLVEDLLKDIRHGARLLGRNPIFALTAALSLAIGIGADTTILRDRIRRRAADRGRSVFALRWERSALKW